MKAVCYKTAVEQFNGREGETATFLSTLSVFFRLACNRFRPALSQPLGGFWRKLCIENWRKILSLTLDLKRELLRHLVATLAFRGGVAVSGAPEKFSEFRAGEDARSAGEILAHIGDLLQGSLILMKGEFVYLQSPVQSWAEDVERFFSAVREFDSFLASDAPLAQPVEKIVQGPIADALTHVGQIVLLRRLAGKPIQEESYFTVEIKAEEVTEKYFSKFIENRI